MIKRFNYNKYNRLKAYAGVFLAFFVLPSPLLADKTVSIADFSVEDITQWDRHNFNKETFYRKVKMDRQWALKAESYDSASGLIKKQRIDLKQTPYLNWSWRVDRPVERLDEHTKEGDDFVARVYVIIDGGVFFWNTLALNYVWSSSQVEDSHWSNPFSDNAQMIAVESGSEKMGRWVTERRNVFEDLKRVFGEEHQFIDAVAIMTDSDNSDGQALAYYGNIYFTSQ